MFSAASIQQPIRAVVARRHQRTQARQVDRRRDKRKKKGAHMGRRQAAETHAGGVDGKTGLRRTSKALQSNLRGLDARALAEISGASDFSAWNSS